ncbi:MAG TPA: retropepsin-like aspartic protease [Candidatus Xenobia bacterium]|nr:retropepsin-like aspartic protease [Candidatus Xenobia bacterium]
MDRVELEYRPPTLLVEAKVNGKGPFWFAFDTGASTSLIDARVSQRLKLKPEQRPDREGPYFTRARTLAVGRAKARDLELVIRDFAPLSERIGREVAGIVGYNWMEQFVFEIDYRSLRLTIWPSTTELIPRADQFPVPLELRSVRGLTGAIIYVPAQMEGKHRCPAEIDTGTDLGILGRQMALELGVDVNRLGGQRERPRHEVRRLDVAGRTYANVPFYVDPRRGADANPYAQCILGNEVLKEFVLTIDIPRRRAFFRWRLPPP